MNIDIREPFEEEYGHKGYVIIGQISFAHAQ